MPCVLSSLLQRRRSASHASNPKAQGAIRRVRFDPVVQYYRAPLSMSQGLDLQKLGETLSEPRSGPSRRRFRDTPHSLKPGLDSIYFTQTSPGSYAGPAQSLIFEAHEGNWNVSSDHALNPYALNQSLGMHEPQAFLRGPNDPPTPWATVVPPLREPFFQPHISTHQWTPITHALQANQDATPNFGIPAISMPQVPPSQPPFWVTPSPVAHMSPVHPQASTHWTPLVAVGPTQAQRHNTPLMSYFCVTQPHTNAPQNFVIPPTWTPIPQIITATNPPPTHPLHLGVQTPVIVPQTGIISSRPIPTTWENHEPCSPHWVTPTLTSQNICSPAVPVAFPSGELLIPGGEARSPMFAPAVPSPGGSVRVNLSHNDLRGDQLDTLLTSGQLNWDIRVFPAMSRFHPARPYVPNLDSPALSNEIATALIEFEDPRLKVFTALWGAIHVQSTHPRAENSASVNSILVKDVMEAIYEYFLEPITEEDKSRFIWAPQQQEEFDMMFVSRLSIQGRLNDQPRRADLLAQNMVNFRRIVVDRAEGGMARLRLILS